MITSVKNESIKDFRALSSKKGRRETGLHLIEGERLVFDALASGAGIVAALVAPGHEDAEKKLEDAGVSFTLVTEEVLASVCDTDSPQGICAKVATPSLVPPEAYPEGLIVCLERIQDPGNLGTVLRTADAFGAKAVLLSEGCVDPYSPKALRAAMGSTYHIPVYQGELVSELKRLRETGFAIVSGHLKGKEALPELPEKRVLIIGNEANGVSNEAAELSYLYRLPMKGRAESLNAAVAAAILIYKLSE